MPRILIMKTTPLNIQRIPALLWGEPADRLFLAVHGFMGSKTGGGIAALAEKAVPKGAAVLSFDLPQHGERNLEHKALTPQNAVPELLAVLEHAQTLSSHLSLYAGSLGAYFSLLAFQEFAFEQCLFLSPVTDMQRLICGMMASMNVSEEQLEKEKEISNPNGQALSWEYYSFVKAHPVTRWPSPTAILYGSADEVVEPDTYRLFAERFDARLQVLPGGSHAFISEEGASVLNGWLDEQVFLS
jgi:uncharacterized protein